MKTIVVTGCDLWIVLGVVGGLFVHAGKLDVAVARRLWSDYSQPIKVTVVAEPSTSR